MVLLRRLLSPEKHNAISSPFIETSEQYFKITKKYKLAYGWGGGGGAGGMKGKKNIKIEQWLKPGVILKIDVDL